MQLCQYRPSQRKRKSLFLERYNFHQRYAERGYCIISEEAFMRSELTNCKFYQARLVLFVINCFVCLQTMLPLDEILSDKGASVEKYVSTSFDLDFEEAGSRMLELIDCPLI